MSELILENVSHFYGSTAAADGVALHIRQGEFFALLGPSGSGKTTILRLIAGFIAPQSGRIMIGGEEVQHTPVHRRNIGFVFQNYALFPHMNVIQNVAFGLESQRAPRAIIQERVKEALALVQLTGFERRKPAQLSGGQQQRVALARALVTQPRVLLLDEPLAALDRKLRAEMQVELRQLQQRLGITTIFVTHDQEEAMTLSDRIAVLKAGKVEQVGEPSLVYEQPRSQFVAEFLGMSNIFTGTVGAAEENLVRVLLPNQATIHAVSQAGSTQGAGVRAVVRPERMHIYPAPPSGRLLNTMSAHITHISHTGSSITYHLTGSGGTALIVFEQYGIRRDVLKVGQEVFVAWQPEHTLILDDEDEA